MFPVLAADTAAIVQGTITVLAIIGGIGWLLDRRSTKEETNSLETRIRSTGTIAARLADVVLYSKPPRFAVVNRQLGSIRVWPITGGVHASVETAGNISVTRGRDLAAKAVGGALLPGGIFLFGNAKNTAHDNRELYLIVEGPDWAHTQAVDPAAGVATRQFAQALNLAAGKLEAAQPDESSSEADAVPEGDDTIERLERLSNLRDSGALTSDEFEVQKRAVLEPDR